MDISMLNHDERKVLSLFALLPSVFVEFSGKSDKTIERFLRATDPENRSRLSISVNSLCRKGWLMSDRDKDCIKAHRFLQDVFRFQLDPYKDQCEEYIEYVINTIDPIVSGSELSDYYIHPFRQLSYTMYIKSCIDNVRVYNEQIRRLYTALNFYLALGGQDATRLDYAHREYELISGNDLLDDYNRCTVLNRLITGYKSLGKFEKAFEYAEALVLIAEKIYKSDQTLFGTIMRPRTKDGKIPLEFIEQGPLVLINALGTKAGVLSKLGKYHEAIQLKLEELDYIERNFDPDCIEISDCHYETGMIYFENEMPEPAIYHITTAEKNVNYIEQLKQFHPDRLEGIYNRAGIIYGGYLNDQEAACLYYQSAIDLQQSYLPPDHINILRNHLNLACSYAQLKNNPLAQYHFENAKTDQQLQILENDLEKAQCLETVSEYYKHTEQYDEAIANLDKALTIKKSIFKGPAVATGQVLNNLAQLFLQVNDFKKAVELIDQSVKIYRELGHYGILNSLKNQAAIYFYAHHYVESLDVCKQFISFYNSDTFDKNLTRQSIVDDILQLLTLNAEAIDYSLKVFSERRNELEEELEKAISENNSVLAENITLHIFDLLHSEFYCYSGLDMFDICAKIKIKEIMLCERVFPDHYGLLARIFMELSQVYTLENKPEEAIEAKEISLGFRAKLNEQL